jgi:hypothetical protein
MIGQHNCPCRGTLDLQPLKGFQILVEREVLTQQDENRLASGQGRYVRCRLDDIIRHGELGAGQDVPETGVPNGVAADQQSGDRWRGAMGAGLRLLPEADIVPYNPTTNMP